LVPRPWPTNLPDVPKRNKNQGILTPLGTTHGRKDPPSSRELGRGGGGNRDSHKTKKKNRKNGEEKKISEKESGPEVFTNGGGSGWGLNGKGWWRVLTFRGGKGGEIRKGTAENPQSLGTSENGPKPCQSSWGLLKNLTLWWNQPKTSGCVDFFCVCSKVPWRTN